MRGGRRVMELKILLRRQGHRLYLIQKDKEVRVDLELTALSENVRLHVLEEPLPRGGRGSHVQYTINQRLVGGALAGDPKVPCWLSSDTPRYVSCTHSVAQRSVVILNLEGDPLVFPELGSNRQNPQCLSARPRSFMWMLTTFCPSRRWGFCPMGGDTHPVDSVAVTNILNSSW